MSLLSFKKFGDLEELKDMLEYVIEDNELTSELDIWEEQEIIRIGIYRRDPDYYKKGNPNCPSNQESANWVHELLERSKQFGVRKTHLSVYFSYSLKETYTNNVDGKTYPKVKSSYLFLPLIYLKNIEESIKGEMKLTQREEKEINKIWITHFEIQFQFKKL
jgi:hypothetical protein